MNFLEVSRALGQSNASILLRLLCPRVPSMQHAQPMHSLQASSPYSQEPFDLLNTPDPRHVVKCDITSPKQVAEPVDVAPMQRKNYGQSVKGPARCRPRKRPRSYSSINIYGVYSTYSPIATADGPGRIMTFKCHSRSTRSP
jgi:hypothetical protein